VPLFSVSKPCSTCSKVFTGDIYGDHVVSCAGIVGIKHRHNVVHDTLVDICFRSGISAGKEVDIGLGGGRDKLLRPADMLLYSWGDELDVCVDLTGSSPLTQTGMVDFVHGRVVIEAAQCKRVKYEAKCADIEYGFLPFSFSSFGELVKDAVTLLKRVRKFSVSQDIWARAAIHIFERIVTASGPGFGDWQWRLTTLPFAFGGLGVYSAGDVLNYAFLASRLQSAALQTKLLRHVSIVSSGSTFDDALSVFNTSMEIDLLSIPSEIAASDWLRVVPISGLGQTMNGSLWGPCCVIGGIVGIKYRHNVVRDTLVDICYRSGISSGKEVDIGLSGERDKSLRPPDVLLYSWDGGRDVCVNLTGSSPLTQTGMVDFVPGRAVLVAAQRKHAKYETKCADIGYGFLPFSFSSFGELEKDAVTLLKRIRKFSVAQDIGARAAIHIFSRICFAIAKGVGAQIVSRLPSNLL
ncbi:hypothetical protein Tco_1018518, partial [Tanacetum coccineum]